MKFTIPFRRLAPLTAILALAAQAVFAATPSAHAVPGYDALAASSPSGVPSSDRRCATACRTTPRQPSRGVTPSFRSGRPARRDRAGCVADRTASVDQAILRAEMNGFDFYVRVLQPWVRDPAYYVSIWTAQSDTPAHEGPTNHAAIELWQYAFPLDAKSERALTAELRTIAPLLAAGARQSHGQCPRSVDWRHQARETADRRSRRTRSTRSARPAQRFKRALDEGRDRHP